MANELKGGSKTDYDDSLAERIEAELDIVRHQYKLSPLTSANREDWRPFLLGISRGIVRFLGENPEAFLIEGTSGAFSHSHSGHLSEIKTDLT